MNYVFKNLEINLSYLLALGCFTSALLIGQIQNAFAQPRTNTLMEQQIEEKARAVTVQIIPNNPLSVDAPYGSGILIKKDKNNYSVLTNRHIVQKDAYTILVQQTRVFTGSNVLPQQKYDVQGSIQKSSDEDLALLFFLDETQTKNYSVATLAPIIALKTGENIFIFGFPIQRNENSNQASKLVRIQITNESLPPNDRRILAGQITRPPLVYKSSTNDIVKGLSGGSILNQRGELVGIHQGNIEKDKNSGGVGISLETILKTFPIKNPPNLGQSW